MQAETEGICAIDDFDTTLIPVEILPCDVTPRTRGTDALSIVELGKQLLHSAKNGDTELVRDLMCRGAPFTTDWLGTSALHFAAQNNHTETAEVLLRAGISRDARTKVDRTPLHMAAYEGHHEMAQLLLNYGAEVDSRDMLKMTPLHWSIEKEHAEVMLVLLEHGADPNSNSKFNKTPVSLALEHDRLDLVDMLQQEREVINVHQNQLQSAEIEAATQNLMQLEAERQKEEQERIEFEQQQQKRRLAQLAANKKQRMVFQQIRVQPINEVEQVKEGLQRLDDKTVHHERKRHRDVTNLMGVEQPLRLLQAHGITMIPVDNDATIVENAMESGQTVVLTEAGKLALNLTRSNPLNITPIKRLQMGARKGNSRKVITIRADQILGQNQPTITPRGPNILKRTASDGKSTGKIFLTSIGNATTGIPTLASTKTTISPMKKPLITPKTEPILLHLDDKIEIFEEDNNKTPIMDVAELNRKLAEARREADEYRRQLQKKEEEAEIYKQQLKNIAAQKTMMK
ncbi:PREDICTED: GA-binding protein subunit beta-2 [Ceratosolen solmsi marchali]|uniref:GA-binding protein subunit beta-2 n=1 Tax=Ceratosolen solmsi marchali TaxID=326594 RepID=A0AAJ6YKN1_9HYME|nr:PREDICTED: GA-binding protein subunit beta-2 [Ceratosolen solmsi marchali]XP_011499819.1 PREDICTED: GA-binding protein subunit beta-2 [Ceratosolen solmsi marchali]